MIAALSSGMPSTAVYLDARPLSMALTAACLILSGVSKSGSPTPSPITLRPAAFSTRALSVTAMVAEGLTRLSKSARKAIGLLRDLHAVPNGPTRRQQAAKARPDGIIRWCGPAGEQPGRALALLRLPDV